MPVGPTAPGHFGGSVRLNSGGRSAWNETRRLIGDGRHPAPVRLDRRSRASFVIRPPQEHLQPPGCRVPGIRNISRPAKCREPQSEDASKVTHLVRRNRLHLSVSISFGEYQQDQRRPTKTNEDQRVPARPAADQQNTKDNSCHTPRTKAAKPYRMGRATEIHGGRPTASGLNSGHDCAAAVKAAPVARRVAVSEP